MKYILKKDLPTHKAGTRATFNNWIFQTEDGEIIAHYSATDLANHPEIFTEWFEPVPEKTKRKAVPEDGDFYYTIFGFWDVQQDCELYPRYISQGNWRWTQEEAELEVRKRAAIERVRRYLVRNDLLEEDKNEIYKTIYAYKPSKLIECLCPIGYSYYSPYGRVKDTDLTQFIKDCREDLLLIHS